MTMEPATDVDEVCVKSEPSWEDVCVKSEDLGEEACVEGEPSWSGICVKEESPWWEAAGARGVSEAAAAAGLYADHAVKDELVIGPELVEPPRELSADRARGPKWKEQNRTLNRYRYQCGHCSYATDKTSTFIDHKRTHTGEKPYKCTQCSCAFPRRTRQLEHERIHSGEKPYKCEKCDFASAYKKCLSYHIKKKHNSTSDENPYKWYKCNFSGTNISDLKLHKKVHDGKKCSQCSYATADKIVYFVPCSIHSLLPKNLEQ